MPKIRHITNGDVLTVAEMPAFRDGIWECGDQRFTDATGSEYEPIADAPVPPTIGAIAFMRLFSREERVKARELRVTDLQLDDFWRQLEDPRTDVVVMALPSIQRDIEYTLQAVKAAGLGIDVVERKAKILTGEVQ